MQHFLEKGLTWDNFMHDYVINEWGPKVKLAHIELTKADIICHDFAMEALKVMSSFSLEEVTFLFNRLF